MHILKYKIIVMFNTSYNCITLLSLPGSLIVLGVGLVTCYTAVITVQITMDIQLLDTFKNSPIEFVDVIEYYMPSPAG